MNNGLVKMSKKSISVIGIMIGADYKDYRLYHMDESWEESNINGTHSSNSTASDGSASGLKNILGYLSIPPHAETQFVVVYDVSCPNKEEQLKKILAAINQVRKNDLLPTLVSIGHEQASLSADITGQVSNIKEVANTENPKDLLKDIVATELNNTKKKLLAAEKRAEAHKKIEAQPPQTEAAHSSSTTNISMMVLGGFIAAVGVAAVAIAFTLLNAATFGIAGLVVAGTGAAAVLSGLGLFAAGAYRNRQTTAPDESLELSGNLVPH